MIDCKGTAETFADVLFELGLIDGERYEMLLEKIWDGDKAAKEEVMRLLSKIKPDREVGDYDQQDD